MSGDDDCEPGYYKTEIPEYLTNHPFFKKPVCRRCHYECSTCYDSGSKSCMKCRNYKSITRNDCVSQCSLSTEFLNKETRVK